jgi:hypothetical protein
VIAGPPCAGKSTLVAELAGPADVVIDLDRIALASPPPHRPHRYPDHVRFVAVDARLAAINRAATIARRPPAMDHPRPPRKPDTVRRYLRWHATFLVIDPGESTVPPEPSRHAPPAS